MRIQLLAAACVAVMAAFSAQAEGEARSLEEIAKALNMTQMELLTAGATGALGPDLQKEVDQALRAQLSGGGAIIAQPAAAQEG